jgi:hypothetical protein
MNSDQAELNQINVNSNSTNLDEAALMTSDVTDNLLTMAANFMKLRLAQSEIDDHESA